MIPRGHAGCEIMIAQHGANPKQLGFEISQPNTAGNVDIAYRVTAWPQVGETFIMSAAFHHLLRAYFDVTAHVRGKVGLCPAEAYILAEAQMKDESVAPIIDRFRAAYGGGPLCDKVCQELLGISHKLIGTYRSGGIAS
jgi:hypothetical protein